jgi:hypothetical protein
MHVQGDGEGRFKIHGRASLSLGDEASIADLLYELERPSAPWNKKERREKATGLLTVPYVSRVRISISDVNVR